ncbi:hypothetical protein GCWU000324_02451 [Kingella oralis ATCC 51147]|uniref:Uncharacterized protein n=1 Tax=Kingella oralis ATCC 51147 TaxID=629741 RepID=C4GK77_9NEIS|nr:hypothetical protein GCWU000324_02451 [Kingella oralis ATCC 51147]
MDLGGTGSLKNHSQSVFRLPQRNQGSLKTPNPANSFQFCLQGLIMCSARQPFFV